MSWFKTAVAAAVIVAATVGTGHAQVTSKKALTLEGAKQVIAAAVRRGQAEPRGRRHRRRRRRRQPDGPRAPRRHLRGGRQHLHRQGAHRGALQEAHDASSRTSSTRAAPPWWRSTTSRRCRAACRSWSTARSSARSASAARRARSRTRRSRWRAPRRPAAFAGQGRPPRDRSPRSTRAQVAAAFAKGSAPARGRRLQDPRQPPRGAGQAEVHAEDDRHHLRARRHRHLRHRRHGRGREDDRARRGARHAIEGGESRRLAKGDVMVVPTACRTGSRTSTGPSPTTSSRSDREELRPTMTPRAVARSLPRRRWLAVAAVAAAGRAASCGPADGRARRRHRPHDPRRRARSSRASGATATPGSSRPTSAAPGPTSSRRARPIETYDFAPHAGGRRLRRLGAGRRSRPTTLDARRSDRPAVASTGTASASRFPSGSAASIRPGRPSSSRSSLDDYAEVWVDGELPRRPRPERRLRDRRAGTRPTAWSSPATCSPASRSSSRSSAPTVRSRARPPTSSGCARRRSTSTGAASRPSRRASAVEVDAPRSRPRRRSCRATPTIEKLAEGFQFTEGPVWVRDGGYLLFSDPNANRSTRGRPSGRALGVPRQERLRRRATSASTASPAPTA